MRPDDVEVSGAPAFKGMGRVTVGNFMVGFSIYDTPSSRSRAGSSAVRSTLLGIDPTVMQRITDEAYAKFVADLKAQGFTVVDRAELLAFNGYAASKSYPNPYEDSSGGLFGSTSRISYFTPSGFGPTKVYQGDIIGTLGGFALDNPLKYAAGYASSTGVTVLHPVYALGFVNKQGGFRMTSAVVAGQGLTALPGATKLVATGNGSGGVVTLGQPVTSEREFATVAETTSAGSRAGEAAVNVLAVLGGVGTSSARDFAFNARPADYTAAVLETLTKVNTDFIAKMVSMR